MDLNKRNVAILGSTGSIGTQTLEVIQEHADMFRVALLVANSSADLLIEQAIKFRPAWVVIAQQSLYPKVKEALEPYGIQVSTGNDAITEAVTHGQINIVVTAMVGYSGLAPTIQAIKHGKTIALANKETMVVAGELINRLLRSSRAKIYPVDSEHGAFYQCLVGEQPQHVRKLLLTASGGPFRTWPQERMAQATLADALAHPKWNMGKKITIDSATMMNKGFEMIEARWLFDIEPERIQIVVHPQSIVHSMVEFIDGSIKAQLGVHDMRLPIRYALGCPGRLPAQGQQLSLSDFATLTFENPDFRKFPMLTMAYDAIAQGGLMPCVLNAANEIAVEAFLKERISFLDIYSVVERTLSHTSQVTNPTYDDYIQSNAQAREYATSLI